MRNILLSLFLVLTLAGCSSWVPDYSGEDSGYRVVLHKPLTVAPGNARVFLQQGKMLPSLSFNRCQPWRAKRRLVDPSSREAALFSRRALRQRENKVGLRTWRPVIGSQVRSSNELAKLLRSAW